MQENILDQLDNMVEYQKIRRLDQLNFALEIFDGNGKELYECIKYGTNLDNKHIFFISNHHLFMQYATNLNRLLHNFIASTYTLMSITKNILRNYEKENIIFYNEFENVNNNLYEAPIFNVFVQLRNYIQHVKLVLPSSNYQWDRDNGESLLLHLDVHALVTYIKKQKSRGDERLKSITQNTISYLENYGEKIDLKNLFEDYIDKIHEFYNWVYSNLKTLHQDDLKKVNDKKKEARKSIVPMILASNIMVYKEGNVSLDEIFKNTMDGRIYDKIKTENHDPKKRAHVFVDYLGRDNKLPKALIEEIIKLVDEYEPPIN